MAIKKTIPFEKLSQDSKALYDIINDGSDLSCVLISASFLNECLASLLKRNFIKSDTTHKVLNSNFGSLGTFSIRSDIAYCLGLIDKNLYCNLTTVGEIRNKFAHNHLSLSFGSSEIIKLCDELTYWKILEPIFEQDNDKSIPESDLKTIARNKFKFSIVLMVNKLLLEGLGAKQKQRI